MAKSYFQVAIRDMTAQNSVTWLIDGLKQGDTEAAEQLWSRYMERLVAVARRKLSGIPKRTFDEEDIALSVFATLCRGAEQGNFTRLSDRDDLWIVLLALTRHKIADQVRHLRRQKRGGGNVRGESAFAAGDRRQIGGLDEIIGEEPTPELLVMMQEEHQRLLAGLSKQTRQVVLLRMEGHRVKEIAGRMGYTTRWVERKLQLVRRAWLAQLEEEPTAGTAHDLPCSASRARSTRIGHSGWLRRDRQPPPAAVWAGVFCQEAFPRG